MSTASGSAAGAGQHKLLIELEGALIGKRPARIERLLQSICSRPALLFRRYSDIEKIMRSHGQQAVLEAFIRSAVASGELSPAILGMAGSSASPAPVTAQSASSVAASWQDGKAIAGMAWRHADQTDIDARLADRLFPFRQQADMPRGEWERRFRFAAALESLTQNVKGNEMTALFHPGADNCLQGENDQQAALYVVGHVGFTAARNHFIRKFLKNSIPFRPSLNRPPYVWEENDGRTALYCGLRALSAGTSIVVAPDGPMGTLRSPVEVAGSTASISTGAIFMAHETRLQVYWLNIEFRDDCFLPVLVKAPQALPKEKLKDYQQRFVSFYHGMLNQYFTGDPANLVIRNRWKAIFLGDAQQGDREE